jgi:hypothetical protein
MPEYMTPSASWKRPQVCAKQPDGNGWWICHACGSMWSDMVSGLGWLPLSCPGREHPPQTCNPGVAETSDVPQKRAPAGGETSTVSKGRSHD